MTNKEFIYGVVIPLYEGTLQAHPFYTVEMLAGLWKEFNGTSRLDFEHEIWKAKSSGVRQFRIMEGETLLIPGSDSEKEAVSTIVAEMVKKMHLNASIVRK